MKLPLEGVRVLDLSHMLPGPFSTMLMADMGAEVIKIEPPSGDSFRARKPFIHEESTAFLMVNRGKKSCVLDLRSQEGHDNFLKLAASADIILEQFRPGVVERLGIDYATIREVNPGIIYVSMSGFGQDGPYRDMPGHDINYLSISGILDTIGQKGGAPALPGIQIADMCGAQWALISVLLALASREKNGGLGQYADLSITDAVFPWLSLFLSDYLSNGTVSSRGSTKAGGAYAFYNVYETADGRFVSLGAAEPKFWANFCRTVGREDWIPRQMDPAMIPELRGMFKCRTQKDWRELLFHADCCFTPVNNIEEALNDPQLTHRRMEINVPCHSGGQVMNFAFPVKFSEMRAKDAAPVPQLGEHNAQLINDTK